jgi:hypothetical protein
MVKYFHMTFIKMYVWSLCASYEFMEGSRGIGFWLKLPFKAFQIAYLTLYR